MKSEEEIKKMLLSKIKEKEKTLDIKIRNGQALEGIKKALNWVLK